MTSTPIIDFSDDVEETHRRLADLPDRVFDGDPHHTTQIRFESPDGIVMSGTWTSTPGKWHVFADRDEICFILSGHCRLVSKDGIAKDFRAGDSFIIPNGFEGHWDVVETTKKHFLVRHVK
jgi:uncharacterized cupin superfamily protein